MCFVFLKNWMYIVKINPVHNETIVENYVEINFKIKDDGSTTGVKIVFNTDRNYANVMKTVFNICEFWRNVFWKLLIWLNWNWNADVTLGAMLISQDDFNIHASWHNAGRRMTSLNSKIKTLNNGSNGSTYVLPIICFVNSDLRIRQDAIAVCFNFRAFHRITFKFLDSTVWFNFVVNL